MSEKNEKSKLQEWLMLDAEVPGRPWEVNEVAQNTRGTARFERVELKLNDAGLTLDVYGEFSTPDAAPALRWAVVQATPDDYVDVKTARYPQGYTSALRDVRKELLAHGLTPLGPPQVRAALWPDGPAWKHCWKSAHDEDAYLLELTTGERTYQYWAKLAGPHGWHVESVPVHLVEHARRATVTLTTPQFEAVYKLASAHGHHWAYAVKVAGGYAEVFETGPAFDDFTEDQNASWLAERWRELEAAKKTGSVPLKLVDAIADKVPSGPVGGEYLRLYWTGPGSTTPGVEHTTTTGRLHWKCDSRGFVLLEVRRPRSNGEPYAVLRARVVDADYYEAGPVLAVGARYGLRHVNTLLGALEILGHTSDAGRLYPITRELDAMEVAKDLATATQPKQETEAASVTA